jgi:hypothetical protein
VENKDRSMRGSLRVGIFSGLHFPVCSSAVDDIAPKSGIDNDQSTV